VLLALAGCGDCAGPARALPEVRPITVDTSGAPDHCVEFCARCNSMPLYDCADASACECSPP